VPTHHIPKPHERPDVEVLVDGAWCRGEVRMQTQLEDGSWRLEVQYRPPGEHSSYIGTFGVGDVREDRGERGQF
jgi:hypothetical protein